MFKKEHLKYKVEWHTFFHFVIENKDISNDESIFVGIQTYKKEK